MTYRTYSGPQGSEEISPLERSGVLYKEFDTLDDALAWARHVNESGRVALLIDARRGVLDSDRTTRNEFAQVPHWIKSSRSWRVCALRKAIWPR